MLPENIILLIIPTLLIVALTLITVIYVTEIEKERKILKKAKKNKIEIPKFMEVNHHD